LRATGDAKEMMIFATTGRAQGALLHEKMMPRAGKGKRSTSGKVKNFQRQSSIVLLACLRCLRHRCESSRRQPSLISGESMPAEG